MSTTVYYTKLQGETINVNIPFLSRLAIGETIASCIGNISVFSGTDSNPASMINGVATFSGSTVTQSILGGVVGVIYTVSTSIRTSNNNILINETKLAIMDSVTPILA